MTERRPLVMIGGQVQQLPTNDRLDSLSVARRLMGSTPPPNPENGDEWLETDASGSTRHTWGWIYMGSKWVSPLQIWEVNWDTAQSFKQFNLALDPQFTLQLAADTCCIYFDGMSDTNNYWKVELFSFGNGTPLVLHSMQGLSVGQWRRFTAAPNSLVSGAGSLLLQLYLTKVGTMPSNCWGSHTITYRYIRQ